MDEQRADGRLESFAVEALEINGVSQLCDPGDPNSDGADCLVRSAAVELLTCDVRLDRVTLHLRNGTTITVAGHGHTHYDDLATWIFGPDHE